MVSNNLPRMRGRIEISQFVTNKLQNVKEILMFIKAYRPYESYGKNRTDRKAVKAVRTAVRTNLNRLFN